MLKTNSNQKGMGGKFKITHFEGDGGFGQMVEAVGVSGRMASKQVKSAASSSAQKGINKAVGVTGGPKPERVAELTADGGSSAPTRKEGWEDLLNDLYVGSIDISQWNNIKRFVNDLLHHQKAELIEEIEKMKLPESKEKDTHTLYSRQIAHNHNMTLGQVISLLKK